jgi:hypothetical protein
VTWAFLYLAVLLVGLVLAGPTGLWNRLRSHRHPVVVPHPEQHFAFLNVVGQRISVGLVFFGVGGLVAAQFRAFDPRYSLLVALGAGTLFSVLALFVLSTPCASDRGASTAKVVRDIPAGGYGQVQLLDIGRPVIMAAKSIDGEAIAAGSDVELVDCQSSVISVKRLDPPRSGA